MRLERKLATRLVLNGQFLSRRRHGTIPIPIQRLRSVPAPQPVEFLRSECVEEDLEEVGQARAGDGVVGDAVERVGDGGADLGDDFREGVGEEDDGCVGLEGSVWSRGFGHFEVGCAEGFDALGG